MDMLNQGKVAQHTHEMLRLGCSFVLRHCVERCQVYQLSLIQLNDRVHRKFVCTSCQWQGEEGGSRVWAIGCCGYMVCDGVTNLL